MADIEYFYAAHSAFAYLGAARLHKIAAAAGCNIKHRPMDLGAVVGAARPGGFKDRGKAHVAYYFAREIERWAEYRNVPVKGGIPTNHGNSTELANTMLIACAEQGQDVDALAEAVMRAHWFEHADLADPATLIKAANSVDVDAEPLLETAQSPEVKTIYAANTAEAIARSVFGSPTYFVDGDMFYGQDRLDMVERAIHQPFTRNWS